MSFDTEPQVLALRRAYCYLRLSGRSSEAALSELRALLDASLQAASRAPFDFMDSVLERVLDGQGAALPEPPKPPPVQRAHLRYP